MKTASAKSKGRRLQQRVVADLRIIGQRHGLAPEDIESRPMGCDGADVILTPAAQRVLPFEIECKNRETLNVTTTFFDYLEKYSDKPSIITGIDKERTLLLVHSRNKTEPLVTLQWQNFWSIIYRLKELENATAEKEKTAKELPKTSKEVNNTDEFSLPKDFRVRVYSVPEGDIFIGINTFLEPKEKQ